MGLAGHLRKVRYQEKLYPASHEAIIDEKTWEAAQVQLEAHRRPTCGRPCISGALLSGLVRCGACGASMTVASSRKGSRKYLYYACTTYQKRGASACPRSLVPAREREAFVLEQLRDLGKDPRLVRETIAAARRALVTRKPDIEEELRHLGKHRDRKNVERQRLVGAVGKGKASPAILERLGALDLEVQTIDEQVAKLEDELTSLEATTIDAADLRSALASFTPVWDQLFSAERTRVMQLLVQSVAYNAKTNEVEIIFRPGGVRALAEERESL